MLYYTANIKSYFKTAVRAVGVISDHKYEWENKWSVHIHTHPCWISSLSFVTFLSSITVKDNEKTMEMFSHRLPQEQLSLMTANMQRLIASPMSQTTGKELQKQLSTYILPLFCGARRNRWGRTVLEKTSWALWSTLRRKGGISHTSIINSSTAVCTVCSRTITLRRHWRLLESGTLRIIWFLAILSASVQHKQACFIQNNTSILYMGKNITQFYMLKFANMTQTNPHTDP